jgi:hypothetical protein
LLYRNLLMAHHRRFIFRLFVLLMYWKRSIVHESLVSEQTFVGPGRAEASAVARAGRAGLKVPPVSSILHTSVIFL